MNSPSSTKEITEIGIFRFFNLFSKIWKTDNKYNANKIGERAEPCLILISIFKKNCSKNTLFFLLDNFGKKERFWG